MKLHQITLAHLRAFVSVADAGSFTDAGKVRLLSQSALTRQIRDLENIVGERVLDRTRGHLVGLTDAGRKLLPYARQVLSTLDEASCEIGRSLTGPVRLGIMDDIHPQTLLELIARFSSLYPHCTISIVSDYSRNLLSRLANGGIDVAVVKRLAPAGEDPGSDVLLRVHLRWVAAKPLGNVPETPLPLVLLSEGCVFRARVLETLARHGIPYRVAYEGLSYSNLRSAISAGLGVTALTDDQIHAVEAEVVDQFGEMSLPDLGYVDASILYGKYRDSALARALGRELHSFARDHFERTYGEPTVSKSERLSGLSPATPSHSRVYETSDTARR